MKKFFNIFVMVLSVVCIVFSLTGCDSANYDKAMKLYEEGSYDEAINLFKELGDYEDSSEMINACNYEKAIALYENGDYVNAKMLFEELDDYEDSTDKAVECAYLYADELYEAGVYEEALKMYESVGDYNDAADKVKSTKRAIMLEEYGDVINMLKEDFWYFNGGSDTELSKITFTEQEATIERVYFDGNGKHTGETSVCEYTVDEENVTVVLDDGSDLVISYSLRSDGNIDLGGNDFRTEYEIENGLNGYWKLRKTSYILGFISSSEYNIYFNYGTVISEDASEAYGYYNGEYYYYGPHNGTYTLNFGGFDTDLFGGSEWGFNIIDGEVVVMHYGDVCSRSTGLPGANGYSF